MPTKSGKVARAVTSAVRSSALGFFRGVGVLFQGLGFIVSTPSTWRYAIVPIMVALFLLGGFGALGIWGAISLTHAILGPTSGTLHTVGAWIIELVLGGVLLVVSALIALSLAQPISGFALEAISRAQDSKLGRPAEGNTSSGSFVQSLVVTLTGLAIGLPLLGLLALITVFCPPAGVVTIPLKFIVTAIMIAWDMLDYPFSIRGVSVGGRLRWMRSHFTAVLGFGLASGALLLVPGIGLLLLPVGAAGATRLLTEADAEAALRLVQGERAHRKPTA